MLCNPAIRHLQLNRTAFPRFCRSNRERERRSHAVISEDQSRAESRREEDEEKRLGGLRRKNNN
ncbi:hypothetical protein INR49_022003 [Caranx melampygus]|nr:hypothetical protein INR49_022003 [Caranx melampygus]